MKTTEIKEYIVIKDKKNHPKLEEARNFDWVGELSSTDEIRRMLNEVFRMNKLSTEMSYVVALDHAKKLKGVCQIGHGDASQVLTSMQNIFTFLLLTGANSFVLAHNHVSEMPIASYDDNIITSKASNLADIFDIEFIGHMIVHPGGYNIDGGIMDGTELTLDYEDLGNDMAATYVFGSRIEGKLEDIKKICEG